MPAPMTENWGSNRPHDGPRGRTLSRKDRLMISKGTLLRLVVSFSAFASLASLAGGFFDGH